MGKYILSEENDGVVTKKEFDSDYLYDVIDRFEEFLRGCGFFFDGRLEIVNDKPDQHEIDETFTVSFNSPIFESPDKGKTIYAREFGSNQKSFYSKE